MWLQKVKSVHCSSAFWRPVAACIALVFAGGAPRLAAQNVSTQATASASIHGTVLNRVTNEPISRALVYSSDELYATLTDDRGHFEFKLPPPESAKKGDSLSESESPTALGPTVLLARKPGFLSGGNGGHGEDIGQEIDMTAPSSEMTIVLDPESLIVGRVLFGSADSTARIRVELYQRVVQEGQERWVSQRHFTTWANGEFRFDELVPGVYKLVTIEQLDRDPLTLDPRGQQFGYQPIFYPNALNLSDAVPIHLAEGATFQANLSAVRRPYYPVKIGVENHPQGATTNILVYPQGHPGPGYTLAYDANEEMIQGMLPDGNYTVQVTTFGEHRATGIGNFTVKGAPVAGIRVSMTPNTSLTVHVKEELTSAQDQGQDASATGAGATRNARARFFPRVRLSPAEDFGINPGAFSHGLTDGDGSLLELDEVQPGRYWVHVMAGNGYASSVMWGGTDLLRQQLVIGQGGSSSPIEITLRDDGAEVTGSVQRAGTTSRSAGTTGRMRGRETVYFVPTAESSGQFREAWTNEDGTFQTAQLPPGTYRVLAFEHQHEELEHASEETLRGYESEGQVIHVAAGQKEHLRLSLVKKGESE